MVQIETVSPAGRDDWNNTITAKKLH